MTAKEKLAHKERVHALCLQMLGSRIDLCQQVIDDAQQASNEEEKSSAGDKFETSRAMNHLEKEMYGKQLQANVQERAAVQSISLDHLYDSVRPGTFIACRDFDFFIAAGLGKIMLDGRTLFLLSPQAPLSAAFKNKKKGDAIIFNKIEEIIMDLF